MLNYIPDGYSQDAYLRESPGLHGEMRFRYRPMLVEEKNQIVAAADKKGAGQGDMLLAEAVARRIVEWDVRDAQGAVIPITADTVRRLRPTLFNRVFWVIAGVESADTDERAEAESRNQQAAELLQAAIEGRPLGAIREEGDRKNCDAG